MEPININQNFNNIFHVFYKLNFKLKLIAPTTVFYYMHQAATLKRWKITEGKNYVTTVAEIFFAWHIAIGINFIGV